MKTVKTQRTKYNVLFDILTCGVQVFYNYHIEQNWSQKTELLSEI